MKLAFPNSRSAQTAVSLVELMVAVGIASIVFAAVGSLTMFTTKSMVAMGNYNDLDRVSRNALDRMSLEIRQTLQLRSYSTNKLVFKDYDGVDLEFAYSPGTAALVRKKGGNSTVLLTECDFLTFNIWQRNPSNGFAFYAVTHTNYATAKQIDVNWRCSRMIFGKQVNTESVQTAKIVLRN